MDTLPRGQYAQGMTLIIELKTMLATYDKA